jgi:hypothetical protein
VSGRSSARPPGDDAAFRDLGSAGEAARHSLLANSACLGHTQPGHTTPDLLPEPAGYGDTGVAALTRGA